MENKKETELNSKLVVRISAELKKRARVVMSHGELSDFVRAEIEAEIKERERVQALRYERAS